MINFQDILFHRRVIVSIYLLAILVVIFPDFILFKIVTGLLWVIAIIFLIYGQFVDSKSIGSVKYSEVFYKKMIRIMYFSFSILSINFLLSEAFSEDWIRKILPYQYLVMVYLVGIMSITGISEKYFGKMYYDFSFLKKMKK